MAGLRSAVDLTRRPSRHAAAAVSALTVPWRREAWVIALAVAFVTAWLTAAVALVPAARAAAPITPTHVYEAPGALSSTVAASPAMSTTPTTSLSSATGGAGTARVAIRGALRTASPSVLAAEDGGPSLLNRIATRLADETGSFNPAARRFTPDQDALIQLAKNAKRQGGLTAGEGSILREWADEYGLSSRGPEAHPGRGFGSSPHYHIGPVNHIPAR